MHTEPRTTRDRPDVVVLPPVLVAGAILLGLALDRLAPLGLGWPAPWRLAGVVLILAAAALALLAERRFKRHGTNVMPTRPTTAIISDGPYAYTRNPIYLGMAAFQLGLALALVSPWTLLLLPVVAVVLDVGVIRREETYLEGKFGEPYEAYKAKVRRWL